MFAIYVYGLILKANEWMTLWVESLTVVQQIGGFCLYIYFKNLIDKYHRFKAEWGGVFVPVCPLCS